MAQEGMDDMADGDILRKQLQQPLNQQHRVGQGSTYQLDGSGPEVPSGREAGNDSPAPPSPELTDEAALDEKRRKNNEAAKRSWKKKRLYEMELVQKIVKLSNENFVLRTQLKAIEQQFGVRGDDAISAQQEMLQQTTAKRPRTSLQQATTSATTVYGPQSHMSGFAVGYHAANELGHRDRQMPTVPHHVQWHIQKQQERLDAVRRSAIVKAMQTGAGPFASVPSASVTRGPQYPSSADGALDLSLRAPAPPFLWNAFAMAKPAASSADTDDDDDGPTADPARYYADNI